jgi:hypothetical protein
VVGKVATFMVGGCSGSNRLRVGVGGGLPTGGGGSLPGDTLSTLPMGMLFSSEIEALTPSCGLCSTIVCIFKRDSKSPYVAR